MAEDKPKTTKKPRKPRAKKTTTKAPTTEAPAVETKEENAYEAPKAELQESNASGQGDKSVIPDEAKGLCWGGFFLGWIWGVFNSVWIALLTLIPIINIVVIFFLLFKGREWAWKKKEWKSVEHFNSVQKKWTIAGLIWTAIYLAIVFSSSASAVNSYELNNKEPINIEHKL